MKDISIDILINLVPVVVAGIFTILFIKPYRDHKNIYIRLMKLKRNYDDPRELYYSLGGQGVAITKIGEQLKEIKSVMEELEAMKDLHPIFSKLTNYDDISFDLHMLFEYNRNPVMLPKHKEFDDDYRMDLTKFFNIITKKAKFPWIKLLLILIVLLGTTYLVFYKLILK